MRTTLTDSLVYAGLVALAMSFFVLSRYLPKRSAFWIAFAKVSLVVVFFGFFNYGQFTLRDDLTYLRNAGILYDRGFDAVDAITQWKGLRLMAILSSGWHIGYLWWNLVAIGFFGDFYFSAIFCNVVLTCIGGWFVRQLVLDAGLQPQYANGGAILFLLHWELLAWSSIVNVKDVPVCVLTLAALYGLSKLGAERAEIRSRIVGGLWFIGASLLLFWIRFYVPALLLLGFALWHLASKSPKRRLWGLASLAGVGAVALFRGSAQFIRLAEADPAQIVQGSIRFLLTPQPWSVDPKYGFLIIPAVLHLLLFVPAIIGARELARTVPTYRLILWCGLVLVVFYGFVDELQGPRHRLQLLVMWSWAQWHWVSWALGQRLPSQSPRPVEASLA